MKKISLIAGMSAIVATIGMIACNSSQEPSESQEGLVRSIQSISNDSLINRGKYLVNIMGCNDCHTPMIMTPQGPGHDTSRLLSGHPQNLPLPAVDKDVKGYVLMSLSGTAMTGPWGTSFAANITSDETGIGNWTEEQFFKAIREGKFKGLDNTRPLLPPMPWPAYAHATDDDIRAIFKYLKATKPVNNLVPAHIPPDQLAQASHRN